jgi:hypothetical protein
VQDGEMELSAVKRRECNYSMELSLHCEANRRLFGEEIIKELEIEGCELDSART